MLEGERSLRNSSGSIERRKIEVKVLYGESWCVMRSFFSTLSSKSGFQEFSKPVDSFVSCHHVVIRMLF